MPAGTVPRGITWIRRLMELMSGRSLLPLSKCLQWERPSWGLAWRVPHGCLHPPRWCHPPTPCPLTGTALPRKGPGSAALQTALQGQRGQLSAGNVPTARHDQHGVSGHVPPGLVLSLRGGRKLQATSPSRARLCPWPGRVRVPDRALLTALLRPDLQLAGQLGHHQEGAPALPFLGLEDVPEDVVPHVEDVFALHTQQVTHHVRGACNSRTSGRRSGHVPRAARGARPGAHRRSRRRSAGGGRCTSRCAASPCPAGREDPGTGGGGTVTCARSVPTQQRIHPAVPTGAPVVPRWCPPPRPAPWQWRGPHRVDLTQDGALGEEEWLAGVHHDEVEIGSPGALRGVGAGRGSARDLRWHPAPPHPAHTGDRLTLSPSLKSNR